MARALGALAVGGRGPRGCGHRRRLAIGRAVIRQLRIEELDVGRLRVRELEVDSSAPSAEPFGATRTK